MERLRQYVIEKLSDDNKKILKYLISTNKINDKNFDKLINGEGINLNADTVNLGFKRWNISEESLDKFLHSKGMGKDDFKSMPNVAKNIIKIFNDNKATDLLKLIMRNKAQIALSDINKDIDKSIYELLVDILESKGLYNKSKHIQLKKDNKKNYISALENIFKLDEYKTPTNTAIGKGELLLRLMLNNSISSNKGDVTLDNGLGKENTIIEVKANNARVKGQLTGFGTITDVYKKLYKNLKPFEGEFKGQGDKVPQTYKNYFKSKDKGSDGSPKDLTDLLNALNGIKFYIESNSLEEAVYQGSFCHCLVDALYEEYKNIKDFNIPEKDLLDLANQISKLESYFVNDVNKWEFNGANIINIVGAIQLYFYYKAENFNYFVVFNNSGKYVMITGEDCFDLKKITELFSFSAPDGSSQGDVVKISINKR